MLFVLCVLVELYALQIFAIPAQSSTNASQSCTDLRVRKEWRSLTIDERIAYTEAVNCLMSTPAKFRAYFPVAQNRYDDFVTLHVNQTSRSSVQWTNADGTPGSFTPQGSAGSTANGHSGIEHDDVHGSASILPWHRYATTVFEDALVNECGWKGGLPYWNWFLDTKEGGGSFTNSPVFDPVSGFGGNGGKPSNSPPSPFPIGGSGGGCISDGPFANRTLLVGPYGKMVSDGSRCLRRDFNPKAVESAATRKVISRILQAQTYAQFCTRLGALHGVGHNGVGGEMMDPFNSPNEPLFFLHHANLDYLWALWQEQNKSRLSDYSAQFGEQFNANTEISMGVFAPSKTVRDLMDTQNRDGKGAVCFKYEGLSIEQYRA